MKSIYALASIVHRLQRLVKQKEIIVNEPITIGLREAAELTGLSHWTLRQYIRTGKLKAVRIGRRVLIEPSELRRLVEEGRA
jgi:excisionase family DNA binding protein